MRETWLESDCYCSDATGELLYLEPVKEILKVQYCERELTCACDSIPIVKWLALASVILHADSVGRAAW